MRVKKRPRARARSTPQTRPRRTGSSRPTTTRTSPPRKRPARSPKRGKKTPSRKAVGSAAAKNANPVRVCFHDDSTRACVAHRHEVALFLSRAITDHHSLTQIRLTARRARSGKKLNLRCAWRTDTVHSLGRHSPSCRPTLGRCRWRCGAETRRGCRRWRWRGHRWGGCR